MSSEVSESEDRRIDLVIRELKRYNIKVAALQETKWFGNAVYHVGKSIVLTAGRETPQGCQPRQRGEGVAIVLTDHAVSAWKAGGEQWRSWGSRIIKATLGGGSRKTSRLHILSCYAPTFAASRAEKDNFFNYLQEALDEIPPNETYVILGDFNARVGSRDLAEEDYWGKSRGPHGFGKMNDAGKELLSFLSLNEATAATRGFRRMISICVPGNTLNQRAGIVLIMPSFVQGIEGDALMPALNEVLSVKYRPPVTPHQTAHV